jgi:hypothetical protein
MGKMTAIVLVAALAACHGKSETKGAVAKADDAKWHCVTYEDGPSDCMDDHPCPDPEVYTCVASEVAWCMEPRLRERECALTEDECKQRAQTEFENLGKDDGDAAPAECSEMK